VIAVTFVRYSYKGYRDHEGAGPGEERAGQITAGSSFGQLARLDRTPVLRFDHLRDMRTAPVAHIQVVRHRGALSHLLSQAATRALMTYPHSISRSAEADSAHALMTSSSSLMAECRFDSLRGWQSQVDEGRERRRRRQAPTVTRDVPEEAVRVLRELGYRVEPSTQPREASSRQLRH